MALPPAVGHLQPTCVVRAANPQPEQSLFPSHHVHPHGPWSWRCSPTDSGASDLQPCPQHDADDSGQSIFQGPACMAGRNHYPHGHVRGTFPVKSMRWWASSNTAQFAINRVTGTGPDPPHHTGISHILERCGPETFQDGPLLDLFRGCRSLLVRFRPPFPAIGQPPGLMLDRSAKAYADEKWHS